VRARLAVPLLVATLLTGCGSSDECSVNFVLGNAIDYAYVWRDPSTECGLDSSSGSIVFRTGTASLEFRTEDPLVVGSHIGELIYISKEGSIWSNYQSSAICAMAIVKSETVDWVWEDHQRISGTIACSGHLSSLDGQPSLTVDGVVFSIYAADDGYYFE
jgi:hypothetical protein